MTSEASGVGQDFAAGVLGFLGSCKGFHLSYHNKETMSL